MIISCIYLWYKYVRIYKNGVYVIAEVTDVKQDVITHGHYEHQIKYIVESETIVNSFKDDKKHNIKSRLKIMYDRNNPHLIELTAENLLIKASSVSLGALLFTGMLIFSIVNPKYFLERFKGSIFYGD